MISHAELCHNTIFDLFDCTFSTNVGLNAWAASSAHFGCLVLLHSVWTLDQTWLN